MDGSATLFGLTEHWETLSAHGDQPGGSMMDFEFFRGGPVEGFSYGDGFEGWAYAV